MTKIIKKMYNHFPRPIEQATNNEMKKQGRLIEGDEGLVRVSSNLTRKY
jgi:hypothetical protein